MEKYFLAILPPSETLEKAESIKLGMKDKFGIKYSLKSPAHITLKMPFSYDEARESHLTSLLQSFASDVKSFPLQLGGIDTFGNRVIFLKVEKHPELLDLQDRLRVFCKQKLHLPDELSDRNYHPHMTLAFKDLKSNLFVDVLEYARLHSFYSEFTVNSLVLLKRIEYRWVEHIRFPFLSQNE